eukprot:CAMPEP_0119013888 /NCGR_PEP_ID=MMETSP1176-20130426/9184_1 /TAXON_ID=265551 /ORGANISM="Synedropsis recta cf, Strain CCMP1620" /LENGTH=234 /DNA_ID=CAMNT_0006967015 /DNA_START=47 /DNA_END=751 /DNA_ORIENTATION=+
MMQSSAFDEALALPFLRQKKKWSMVSTSSTEASTIATMLNDSDSTMRTSSSMLDDSDYSYEEDYDLEDPFAGLIVKHHDNETAQMLHMETIVFGDDALAQERHGELMGINDSLKQINTIHQDLAGIVEAQDTDIKRMSWFAIESFENTESGLEQVVRAAKYSDEYQYSQRRKTLFMVLFGVIAVLGFSRSVLVHNSEQQQDGNMIKTSHASNMNQLHTPMIYIPDSGIDGMMQP